ncbi:MAG: hypothetical protein WAS54_01660 [Scrofimicrobium sp.]
MKLSTCGSTELRNDWHLLDGDTISKSGSQLSTAAVTDGILIPRMPATILRAQVDAGMYEEDLYSGDALTRIDQDLWKRDWWYTLTFDAPAGHERYSLQFDCLNYRAEIWLNGHLVADRFEATGSWRRFEFDVTNAIRTDEPNHLAVLVIPERRTPGLVITDIPTEGEPTGVDLADTWADWLNFHYHGNAEEKQTFVPDKNSGIFRRVFLNFGGPVEVTHPYVVTELPQLAGATGEVGDEADLTVHADLRNFAEHAVAGTLTGVISREGRLVTEFDSPVTLKAGEHRDFRLSSKEETSLHLESPDLWWPYTWGDPALYQLELTFAVEGEQDPSDTASLDFGIRQFTGHRDQMNGQPQFGNPGSFYMKVNGRDYLVRGGAYSPDLLFESNDPDRVRRVLEHAKDLGLNMLRWEGHLIDDGLLELCDREGMPAMLGTMCCGAWERWHQWDDEDYDTARNSIHDTVRAMRAHPAVAIWSNGSDGMPPEEVLGGYHRALESAHWQNPILDTVSTRNRDWSGIHMDGSYTWRSPAFWFMPDNPIAMGSCAEEGNNEAVPLLSSMKKMLPGDALWPFNETWSMHGGSMNSQLGVTRKVINRRFGGADTIEDFVLKAQIAQYEGGRAQMEAYAARGWDTNKFTIYWMMNAPWPSFFGHIFDSYWGKGGIYYGIKEAMLPVTLAFDYFAEGDRETAKIHLINQTLESVTGLQVRTRVYRADGTLFSDDVVEGAVAEPLSNQTVTTLVRPDSSAGAVYFVRLTLTDANGEVLKDGTYWQAHEHDVPNLRVVEGIMDAMRVRQFTWPDFSSLTQLPSVGLDSTISELDSGNETRRSFRVTLTNPSDKLAFFIRLELRHPGTEEEILPSQYSSNFVTVYPGETLEVVASVERSLLTDTDPDLHIEGANLK